MENIEKPKQIFGDIWVIKCVDYIDAHNADVFERYIREALKEGQTKLVLDFSGLSYFASTGCNVLLGYLAAARRKGGDMLILKPNNAVMEVLRLLGLSELINIVNDMDAATAFFKRQSEALSSGELKVEDLVARTGGSPDDKKAEPLLKKSEWDGTKVPDPIEVGAFGQKKDEDKDSEEPPDLIPDDVVEVPRTPVEEAPEPEKKKKEPKKPKKSGKKESPAPEPRKEKSKRKARDKRKRKKGKKKKKNRGKKK